MKFVYSVFAMSAPTSNLGLTNIPPLVSGGILPVGVHVCILEEIRQTFAHVGLHPVRAVLFESLERFAQDIQALNFFPAMYVDGSFTTDKVAPNDIDVCLELPKNTPETKARLYSDDIILQILNPVFTKHTYKVDVLYWRPDFPDHNPGGINQLTLLRTDDARDRGLSEDTRKGVLKVML
jgi:hypothetical protein